MSETKYSEIKALEHTIQYHIKYKKFDEAVKKLRESGECFKDAPHMYWMLAGDIYSADAANSSMQPGEYSEKCRLAHYAYDKAISVGMEIKAGQGDMSTMYAKKADLYLDTRDNENAYKFYDLAANSITLQQYMHLKPGYIWSREHVWSKPVEKIGLNEFNTLIRNGCERKSSEHIAYRSSVSAKTTYRQ